MKFKSIYSLLIFFALFSCSKTPINPQLPEEIFEKYKGSIVLIASQYYYEIYVGNEIYYYSPNSQDKLFTSKGEVLNHLSFSTGTGFIVSDDGKIITNNHVVNHVDENYKTELYTIFTALKLTIFDNVKMYNDSIHQLKEEYNNPYEYDQEYDEYQVLQSKLGKLEYERTNLISVYNKIENLNVDNSISKLIIHKLGIAYNDTHVENDDDLQECVVIKTSENEKIDLALIQTKSKSYNKKPKNIFNFIDNNPNIVESPEKYKKRDIKNPIKINEDVFMIGFNKGFMLANTKQGIKSQFTSGKISQENDGERILYTIPTLEGSSGSPIVDKWGNLVGVNFAKISNSQSFSFGIPVYVVKKFYEE